jgi:carboxylesterase
MKETMRICLVALLLASGCDSAPDITADMLDGDVIFDPAIADPTAYLLSRSNPNPSAEEAARPVFIAVHGYSASTFEWNEFRTWSGPSPEYFITQVLLAGHGMTYEDFQSATWRDWQQSIVIEYDRLINAGYTNINLVGSSAGGALLLEMLGSGYFDAKLAPRNILLVDPLVVPSDKLLSVARIAGPLLGYAVADNTAEEDRYWYHFRPPETLRELRALIVHVRKQLEDGVAAPTGTRVKVYKSIRDATADPVGAVMIYKGLRHDDHSRIEVEMVNSELHVYTRLDLRGDVSSADVSNQEATFADFVRRASE